MPTHWCSLLRKKKRTVRSKVDLHLKAHLQVSLTLKVEANSQFLFKEGTAHIKALQSLLKCFLCAYWKLAFSWMDFHETAYCLDKWSDAELVQDILSNYNWTRNVMFWKTYNFTSNQKSYLVLLWFLHHFQQLMEKCL